MEQGISPLKESLGNSLKDRRRNENVKLRHNEKRERFVTQAKKVCAAATFGLAALLVSPEHILKFEAPIPLAFTLG